MAGLVDQLNELLDRGLFVKNLFEMCEVLSKDQTNQGLPSFVMQSILGDLIDWWRERPVLNKERILVEERLLQPLRDAVSKVFREAGPAEKFRCLEELVGAWRECITEIQR